MDKKLTIKQETFAQRVVENGGKLSAAYREAYDAENMSDETVKVHACQLANYHPGTSARIAELRGELLERHRTSVDTITIELEDARRLAMEDRAAGPAVQAIMGKAKLHGLLVDKKEVTTPQGVKFVMMAPDAERKAGD
jgi:phage terminase small subunit